MYYYFSHETSPSLNVNGLPNVYIDKVGIQIKLKNEHSAWYIGLCIN